MRYVIFNVDGKLGDGVLLTFLVEGIVKMTQMLILLSFLMELWFRYGSVTRA